MTVSTNGLPELFGRLERLERSVSTLSFTSGQQSDEFRQSAILLRQSLTEKTSTLPAITNEVAYNHNLIGSLLNRLDQLESSYHRLAASKGGGTHSELDALRSRVDQLNPVPETIAALFRRVEHLENVAGQLALKIDELVHALAAFSGSAQQQLNEFHQEYRRENDHEAKRVDYALGEIEGLGALRDEFHATRRTADYRRVFDEAEPLVSICVATYNRADLLIERCLGSLIGQTYKNLQIIVVGDHCTDDTEERIRALGDPRIEFHNLPSPSVYPAPGIDRWRVAGTTPFNLARSMARGAFIAHLDDDDTSDPSRIEILVREAQKHRADFVWHSHWRESEDGQWTVSHSEHFKLTQVNLGLCLYHRFFLRLEVDIHAYRMDEPGDWNFLRRVKHLRPNMRFVDLPLTRYFALPKRPPFVPGPDETYLD